MYTTTLSSPLVRATAALVGLLVGGFNVTTSTVAPISVAVRSSRPFAVGRNQAPVTSPDATRNPAPPAFDPPCNPGRVAASVWTTVGPDPLVLIFAF